MRMMTVGNYNAVLLRLYDLHVLFCSRHLLWQNICIAIDHEVTLYYFIH
jgi:hypothetical protein